MEGLFAAVALALLNADTLRRGFGIDAEEVDEELVDLLQAVGALDENGFSTRNLLEECRSLL